MARPVLLAALAAYLALSAAIAWRSIVLAPYSDMLDWIARWEAVGAGGDLLAFLFAPHNFNRAAGTFATLALDIRSFGGQGLLFPVVGILFLGAAAAVLAREAWRAAPEGLGLGATVLAVMVTLMAGNLLDAAIHININYVQSLALAAGAIALAGRPSPGAKAGAIACAVLAPFGNAAGFAVWPALAVMAWKARAWRWLAVVLVVGLGLSAAYAAGQSPPGPRGGFDPGAAASLVLHYLGLPWTRAFAPAGAVLGTGFLIVGLAAVALRGRTEAERVAVGLITFSLATAALAALGRTGFDAPSNVPLRYAPFLTPMHVGLLILALPWVARLPRWTLPATAALILAQQAVMGLAAVRTTDVNRQLIADFRAGERRPDMVPTVSGDLSHAERIYGRLAAQGLYQRELHLAKPSP